MYNILQHLVIVVSIFFALTSYADCGDGQLSVFPSQGKINQNSIFVLSEYSEDWNIILGLNSKFKIYLKSKSKKVQLLVTKTFLGEFNFKQALLKPEFDLEIGTVYTLVIDSLPEFIILNRYNTTTKKHEPFTYTVMPMNDTKKPLLSFNPKILKKTLAYYGCGPSTYVVFSNPAKDLSEIIVRTTLKHLATSKETTCLIEVRDNKIYIGHDMCNGAFTFYDSNNYEVRFSFMDASGNISDWTGETIRFVKPTKVTYDE